MILRATLSPDVAAELSVSLLTSVLVVLLELLFVPLPLDVALRIVDSLILDSTSSHKALSANIYSLYWTALTVFI